MQDAPTRPLSPFKHLALLAVAACLLIWPLHSLFGDSGVFVLQLSRALPRQTAVECLLVLGISYAGLRVSSRRRGTAILFVAIELYARWRGIDVSIALVAAYALGVYSVGYHVSRWLYPQQDAEACDVLRAAFLGVLTWGVLIWLASLAGWGKIAQIRSLALIFLGVSLMGWAWRSRHVLFRLPVTTRLPYARAPALMLAVITTTVLLMFAKASVSIDFDSLWYGVSADRTLLAAGNLFADEGLVAHVHYYPKLFESLQIPLLGAGSLSLIIGSSIVCWLLLLLTVHRILGEFDLTDNSRLLGSLLAATVPAVCNSALTSKGELFAAWLCLFALYAAFRFERDCRRYDWLCVSCAAALLAPMGRLSVLPYAALIFLYAVALAVLATCRRGDADHAREPRTPSWAMALPVLMTFLLVALVCLRTYWLTGMPLTTPDVLVELQSRLGLHLRDAIGQYHPAYRVPFPAGLYSYLMDPSRYIHVALFWTGNVWLYLIIHACLVNGRRWMFDRRIIFLVMIGIGFFAVLFGYRSTEDGADGNYFIVPVTCLLMAGFIGVFKPGAPTRRDAWHPATLMVPASIVFGLGLLLCAANWRAGTRRPDLRFDRMPFSEMTAMGTVALTAGGLQAVAIKIHALPASTRAVGDIREDLAAFLPLRYESLATIAWQRPALMASPLALATWLTQARIRIIIVRSPATTSPVDQLAARTIDLLVRQQAATRVGPIDGAYAVWQLKGGIVLDRH